MNIPGLDIASFVFGVVISLAIIFLIYIARKFKRKKRAKAASEVKEEIMKGHKALQEANKIYNDLYGFFDNLEEIERRLDK